MPESDGRRLSDSAGNLRKELRDHALDSTSNSKQARNLPDRQGSRGKGEREREIIPTEM